jgi:lipopolysaccharide export system permease protein
LIINRYLTRELAKPLTAILGVLVALFASYSVASFLSEAVNGLLPASAIAEMTFLKVLISLEVLIPASLYVSVLLTFARLYGSSEFAAMFALRLTPATMMRAVLTLSACLALIVGGLSLFVRPWAYQRLHELSNRAATMLDVDAMEAGSFYVGQSGTRVIFLGHRDGPGAPARDVFVKLRHTGYTEIVSGRLASTISRTGPNSGSDVKLNDAYIYKIYPRTGDDEILQTKGIIIDPNTRDNEPIGYGAVAASSRRLAASSSSEDIAEFQWRLSTPLSTFLLGMLAIPLSRGRPRQSRQAKFGTAALIYFGYYLLCTSARTWVQHGMIARFPGIWWAPALLMLLLLLTTYERNLNYALRRGRT